jgi:hypothetical protein
VVNQILTNGQIVLPHRQLKWCHTMFGLDVGVGAALNQPYGGLQMAVATSVMQRGAALCFAMFNGTVDRIENGL